MYCARTCDRDVRVDVKVVGPHKAHLDALDGGHFGNWRTQLNAQDDAGKDVTQYDRYLIEWGK